MKKKIADVDTSITVKIREPGSAVITTAVMAEVIVFATYLEFHFIFSFSFHLSDYFVCSLVWLVGWFADWSIG